MTESTIISAFTESQAIELAGISLRQLRYWDQKGYFRPSYGFENRRVAHSRIYSFVDIVGLRTLGILRNEYGVPFQHLKKVVETLSEDQSVWSKKVIYVKGKRIQFDNGEGGFRDPETGEDTLPTLPLSRVANDVRAKIAHMGSRKKSDVGKIEKIGKKKAHDPLISGTRIRASTIKSFWDAGYGVDRILSEYPSLFREDVEAALQHFGVEAA